MRYGIKLYRYKRYGLFALIHAPSELILRSLVSACCVCSPAPPVSCRGGRGRGGNRHPPRRQSVSTTEQIALAERLTWRMCEEHILRP